MINTQTHAGDASGLVSTWVTTVDARGRTHLEARWAPPAPAVRVAPAPAAPAAAVAAHAVHAGHAA